MHLTGNGSLLCAIGQRGRYRLPAWTGLAVALASMGACAAVYVISSAAGAIPHEVLVAGPVGQQSLNLGLVLSASSIAASCAAIVFLILNVVSQRPMRNFVVLSLVVFALSLFSPFSIVGAPAGMVAALLAMHILTAGITVGFLTALAEPQ